MTFKIKCEIMRNMKLNSDKIRKELKRIGKNQTWLAKRLGVTRQRVSGILKAESLRNAERLGKIFNINPRDLIR